MRFARTTMPAVLLTFFTLTGVAAQDPADVDAINQLLDRYGQLEDAGDMTSQAQMMSPNRIWIAGGGFGRRTNQALNMRVQQASHDAVREQIPGIQYFSDLRDRVINVFGSGRIAVVSFYWYTDVVLPADAPPEAKEAFVPPVPLAYTLVLEKQEREWKIVHTHWSNFHPPVVR